MSTYPSLFSISVVLVLFTAACCLGFHLLQPGAGPGPFRPLSSNHSIWIAAGEVWFLFIYLRGPCCCILLYFASLPPCCVAVVDETPFYLGCCCKVIVVLLDHRTLYPVEALADRNFQNTSPLWGISNISPSLELNLFRMQRVEIALDKTSGFE